MTDIAFGDIDPDDAYCADGDPDPDQVAIRLHENRAAVENLIGQDLDPWSELTPAEQSLALAVGVVVVDWLRDTDPDDPTAAARQLHHVRRYWSRNTLPVWEDLDPDSRAIGIDLMTLLIDWLHHEGSLR